jgi:hypothetical protein
MALVLKSARLHLPFLPDKLSTNKQIIAQNLPAFHQLIYCFKGNR